MRRALFSLVATLLVVLGLVGGASANGATTYSVHAGDAVLAAISPALSPAIAAAPNGDTIEVRFTGEINTAPKSASGSGTFEHKNAAGDVVGSGTVTATRLMSFKFYGHSTDPTFPPDFTAGKALISVVLEASSGATFDGVLTVTCHLPGAAGPPGTEEGIRLNVKDAINFNHEAGGGTL